MIPTREEVLKLADDLRWRRYDKKVCLRHLERALQDYNHYSKNPGDLLRKYKDVCDYIIRQYGAYINSTDNSVDLYTLSEKDLVKRIKAERKKAHISFGSIKRVRKMALDTLSKLPKKII